ncbi:MAG: toxin-antitoxin system HicB family antitoxin [Vicinamibacterales bacterium]
MSARRARSRASGRFLLRLDPGLHEALREAARDSRLSLNDYCARTLALAGGHLGFPGVHETVVRAAAVAGRRLLGVIAFGSWARGDLADRSDVDVLVVVEPGVRLVRALYGAWDEKPVEWNGRPVEPHFVCLPGPADPVTGLWAEVAMDGVVLFERGLKVSTALVRIRREIMSGRLVRRLVHGQPYWTEVA